MPAASKVTPISNDPIARRLARYVNEQFDGNLSEAAVEIGVDYDRLWRYATGRNKMTVNFALVLSHHSRRSVDFWLTGKDA